MRILVVDDTEAMLLLMTRFVGALGHEAISARNGLEAVEVWRKERPELVLMDIMMPFMSGPEAAAIIKEEAGETWVPIVFVTGVGEENTLAEAIERAADDYLHKPVNFRVLEAKLKAFHRTLELNRKVREQSAKLADYYDRAEEEKRVVRHLMEQMVNADRLADPSLEYWLTPAESLSGDLIAAARTPGKILHVMLADGIGHGITAALNVLPLTQPFYSMTEKGYATSDILVEMNDKIRQVLPVGRFVAVTLLAINEIDSCIEIWNGGMPELQVLNQAGKVLHTCKSFSLPLGVVPSHVMDFMPERYYFNEPGHVLAYSDGLIEARNADGQEFGLKRLMESLCGAGPSSQMQAVQQSFSDFLAGLPHHDDVSMVLTSFGGNAGMPARSCAVAATVPVMARLSTVAEMDDDVLWRYSLILSANELKYINTVPFMMSFVSSIHELSKSASDIFLILNELFVNALDHGVLNLDSSLKNGMDGMEQYLLERMHRLSELQEGRIEIDLVGLHHETGHALRICVKDSGAGFDWQRIREADHLKLVHGRGIALVQSLCVSLQYHGVGNEAVAYYVPHNVQKTDLAGG